MPAVLFILGPMSVFALRAPGGLQEPGKEKGA